VKVDDSVAGFVLVKRGSEVSGDQDVWDMAEFFVMREFRRQGIGTQLHMKSGEDFLDRGKFE
jgi:predicted acetyltransferase